MNKIRKNKISETDILDEYVVYYSKCIHSNLEERRFIYKLKTHCGLLVLKTSSTRIDLMFPDIGYDDKMKLVEKIKKEPEYMEICKESDHFAKLRKYRINNELGIVEILMDHHGKSLQTKLNDYIGGSPEFSVILNWMKGCVEAMAFLEEKKIYHGDIKPGNILLDDNSCIKITDLGESQKIDHGYNSTIARHEMKQIFGISKDFASPEIISYFNFAEFKEFKGYIGSCDIYSLGLTFWVILKVIGKSKEEMNSFYVELHGKYYKMRNKKPEAFKKEVMNTKLKNQEIENKFLPILANMMNFNEKERISFKNLRKIFKIYDDSTADQIQSYMFGKPSNSLLI